MYEYIINGKYIYIMYNNIIMSSIVCYVTQRTSSLIITHYYSTCYDVLKKKANCMMISSSMYE